jgi:hypothetical protein
VIKELTVERTHDMAYVESVLRVPGIYENITDDSCPSVDELLETNQIENIPSIFLKVSLDKSPAGWYWLVWKGVYLEAHTALLPNCRGRLAIEATKKAIDWVFANTPADGIRSYAWSDAPTSAWLCKRVGMVKENTEAWSATRKNSPVSITYYSLRRPS